MDNTYKVAWARALVELLMVERSPRQDYHFDEIAVRLSLSITGINPSSSACSKARQQTGDRKSMRWF